MSDERQDFATPESVHAAMRRAGGVVTPDPLGGRVMDQRERREAAAKVVYEHRVEWDRAAGAWRCRCGTQVAQGAAFLHVADELLAVLGQDEYEQVGSRWHNGEMVPTFVRRAGEGTPPRGTSSNATIIVNEDGSVQGEHDCPSYLTFTPPQVGVTESWVVECGECRKMLTLASGDPRTVLLQMLGAGEGTPPTEPPHDCGHRCCDTRTDPHHDHWLSPEECPRCGAAVAYPVPEAE